MSYDQMIIRCLNCGTKNRIPRDRLYDLPICGRCNAHLDEMIIRCLGCGTKNRMPEDQIHRRPICGRCSIPLVISAELGHPLDVTDETFAKEVLYSSEPVLMEFWAPWCAPCRIMAPILEELASKYARGIKIVKLNADENPLTTSKYNIKNIPTIILFKDGKIFNRLVGTLPKEEIERHLLSIIKTN